ncbi:hypothetical protein Ahy_B01g055123 [Arachis hypogaea]|uniref:RNase H type-1 domain-containing protein n=1 Tax=Arachis hypogaea TaxID=3818 RepID=A0A445AV53_ARAHY|nr:hypothetical protein Ahy_B01g055123 [Arachis hypogaea]
MLMVLVIHGLNIATTNGYHNLVVESDSAAAINFINHGCSPVHSCAPLVQDIRILANRVQKITWIHSLREANSVADLLAKKGQDLPIGLHLFDQAPHCISYALLCDCFDTIRRSIEYNQLMGVYGALPMCDDCDQEIERSDLKLGRYINRIVRFAYPSHASNMHLPHPFHFHSNILHSPTPPSSTSIDEIRHLKKKI